jgi:hypothetical protein
LATQPDTLISHYVIILLGAELCFFSCAEKDNADVQERRQQGVELGLVVLIGDAAPQPSAAYLSSVVGMSGHDLSEPIATPATGKPTFGLPVFDMWQMYLKRALTTVFEMRSNLGHTTHCLAVHIFFLLPSKLALLLRQFRNCSSPIP